MSPFAPPPVADEVGDGGGGSGAGGVPFLAPDQQLTLANVAGWICIFIGLVAVLAPERAVEMYYGATKKNKEDVKLYLEEEEKAHRDALPALAHTTQYANLCLVEIGLVWVVMSYWDVPFLQANCIASLPWLFFAMWTLHNAIPKKLGRSNKASYTLLMLNVPRFIAFMMDDPNAQLFAVQMNIVFALINGLVFCLMPSSVQSLYGLPHKEHHRVLLARQGFGNHLFSLGVFGATIIWVEVTNVMAFGLSWASALMGMLWLMGETKRAGADLRPVYVGLCLMTFFTYTLTYQPQHTLEEEVETVAVVSTPWWDSLCRLVTISIALWKRHQKLVEGNNNGDQ